MLKYVYRHLVLLAYEHKESSVVDLSWPVDKLGQCKKKKNISYLQAFIVLGCYAAYVVVVYQRFGITYRPCLQESNIYN